MRKLLVLLLLLLFSWFISTQSNGQSLPVGTSVLDDYYRRMQLVSKVDSNVSFTVKPLFNPDPLKASFTYYVDTVDNDSWRPLKPFEFFNKKGFFTVLPLTLQQQYNSNYPYGWNDGGMIPGRGYQTMVSGGFYLKIGPLSIQIRPEYVYAQNREFVGFSDMNKTDLDLRQYYFLYNTIDNPERFGNSAYRKLFLGQSSIRLTFSPISIGISNENVWWGPGINNALILSNNAPGFKHLTVNTVRPINTYLGKIEFQWIAGHLEATQYTPIARTTTSAGESLLVPKRNDLRYFTGFTFNYGPKWVPGLTLGLTRTFNAYKPDVSKFSDYFPLFFPYQKANTNDGDPINRDQITSLYARWLFKKSQAEIYFEYGLNDNAYNYRDFLGSSDRTRAYLFGFRKMLSVGPSKGRYILFEWEVTQMSQSVDRLVHDGSMWYRHYQVTQGHTNLGQVLGAGIGPGGNLQHVGLNWLCGLKKLGITFDRYEHNVDLSDLFYYDINGGSRKWVDLAFGLNAEWNYRNLLLNAKFQYITSLNYQWILKNYIPGQYYIPNNTVNNINAQLGITYRF